METDLARLLSLKFIQRPDAKAQQTSDGAWFPVREKDEHGKMTGPNIGWKMRDLRDHIEGVKTFGNYMVDDKDQVKLFVFDIDLDKTGTWAEWPDLALDKYNTTDRAANDAAFEADTIIHQSTPREDWLDRKHPGRKWYKIQLRTVADLLKRGIEKEIGVQTAVAYTGSKGLHVYGFTGTTPASTARAGALLSLEAAANLWPLENDIEPFKGKNFYKFTDTDPHGYFNNVTIEVFPKQENLSQGGYGNLVRLPLGRNMKNPKDQCFFVDTSAYVPSGDIVPHPDPARLLNEGY